jgi:hypothetical protein
MATPLQLFTASTVAWTIPILLNGSARSSLAQEDRKMKYATIPIVDMLNDVRQAQMEADTAMYGIWYEYLTVLVLIFCAPIVMRLLMADAYAILVTSPIGQLLLVLLVVAVVYSLLRAVKLNKPVLA